MFGPKVNIDRISDCLLTINVPVVYMGQDLWIWMGGFPPIQIHMFAPCHFLSVPLYSLSAVGECAE